MKCPSLFFGGESLRRRMILIAMVVAICTFGNPSQSAAQVQIRAVQIQARAAGRDLFASHVFRGVDEATFNKQLDDQAKVVTDRIVKITGIGESQRQKLLLAATGDLRRFCRELERAREETKDLDTHKQQRNRFDSTSKANIRSLCR